LPTTRITKTCKRRKRAGFTLLEIIIVVMILAIVSVAAFPLMAEALGETRLEAAAGDVSAALNYARLRAQTTGREHQVVFRPILAEVEVREKLHAAREQLEDPSVSTLSGGAVDAPMFFATASHPVHYGEDYVLRLRFESRYRGAQLLSADFGGAAEVVFDGAGVDSGGEAVLRLGNRQRVLKVNPVTGGVTVSW